MYGNILHAMFWSGVWVFWGSPPLPQLLASKRGPPLGPLQELLEADSGTLLAQSAGQAGKVSGNCLESLAV